MTRKLALLALCLVLAAPSAHAGRGEDSLSGTYLAGRMAGKHRETDIAIEYITRALKLDPGNPNLIERLFQLQVSAGDLDEAKRLAGEVLSFNSQHRLARTVLGLVAFRERRYIEARAHFSEAAYTPVGELTSALLTAWAYAGEGEIDPAMRELDKLDQTESFANFKSFHAALIADFLGASMRADAAYKKAYEQAGSSLRVVQAYGNFLDRAGRSEAAQDVYASYLSGGDRNVIVQAALDASKKGVKPEPFIATPGAGAAEALFSLAAAMTDEQSIDVALVYTQLSLSFNADRPVALTLLGDIYGDTQRFQQSIDAYEQIPNSSPLRNNADTEIALNLQRLDRTKEAQSRLKEVIARDPRNYAAVFALGNIYRLNEEFAEAAASYNQAVDILGGEPPKEYWRLLYYRGISYERQKLWDKAEPDFRKALAMQPDEPTVLNYLGYSMIEKKINLDEAMGMVQKAVEQRPNDGFIIDSLGWAHYQLGDFEEAVTHLERAVELNPADPIIGEHLGDAYWQVGRKLEAHFQWQHAKDNDPTPEDLKRIEDKLKNGMPELPKAKPASTGNAETPPG
jgi:tetratricopeptide (TPR) repeat protein